mgnify:CR=1 FL=1
MSNKVLITNSQKAVKVPSGLRILIRRACNAVLEFEHFEAPAEISVTFVDNAAIAELNNQYRNKPMPTDVLSFPLGVDGKYDVDENNGCKMLGDIVISMERAQEQATLYGHPLQREVAFLTVHSMLHLLGYDHVDGGLEAALQVVRTFILVEVPVTKLHNADYKTELQELVQREPNRTLVYRMAEESGPDHDKQFSVEVSLNGTIVGKGVGSSKKRAEQDAARCAIENLFPDKA